MKEGRFFRIPEGPADMDLLWSHATPLGLDNLPKWLEPCDAEGYRYIGAWSHATLPENLRADYFTEMEEMQAVGLIADHRPYDPSVHHLYIGAPKEEQIWSIGILYGNSPLYFGALPRIDNPVLTRDDVTDVSAVFVADPFMLRTDAGWHLFCEVMNWRTGKGEIGLAESQDGETWTYRQIVLTEPFHLSYPYVFMWQDDYYMIPESYQAGAVRLYRAEEFPMRWSFVSTLLTGPYLVDASVFRHGDRWWLFTETNPAERHDTLRLFYADNLIGPWREHPRSPIVERNMSAARPAGRVLSADGSIIRYAQNCRPSYGMEVRAFEITDLTPTSYREREVGPVLTPSGVGWNADGMHHIDAHRLNGDRWIACVDGWFQDEKPSAGSRGGFR